MTRGLVAALLVYAIAIGASIRSYAVAPAEAGPVEAGPAETGPAETGPAETGIAQQASAGRQAPTASTPLTSPGAQQALLNQYCVTCHNAKAKTGGLSLDGVSLERVNGEAELWEKVVRKLRAGLMPPAGLPRPPRATLDAFAGAVETAIDRAADVSSHPGRVPLHRMNRVEYANAIRDLLAVDVDATTVLPADNSSRGFDNIADVLGVSPSLLEGYVEDAAKISRLAVGDREAAAKQITYSVKGDLSQDRTLDGQPLGTRGGTVITHNFPVDGEYTFRLSLRRSTGGVFGGGAVGQQIEVTLNGQIVKRYLLDAVTGSFMREVPGSTPAARPQRTDPLDEVVSMNDRLEFHLAVKAGPHIVGVAFVQPAYEVNEDLVRRPLSTTYNANIGSQYGYTTVPHLAGVTITGPYAVDGVGDTPSRRRVFVCRPMLARTRNAPPPQRLRRGLVVACRRYRQAKTRAPVRSCRPLSSARSGARPRKPTSMCCSGCSVRSAIARRASTGESSWRCDGFSRTPSSSSGSKGVGPTCGRACRTASTTPHSLRACRSFCGPRFRTTSC